MKRRDKAAKAMEFPIKIESIGGRKVSNTNLWVDAGDSHVGRFRKRPVVATFIGKDSTVSDPNIVKSIISKLSSKGVLVPELIAYSSGPEMPVYVFEKLGRKSISGKGIKQNNLYGFLLRQLKLGSVDSAYLRQLRKYVSSAARSIGTMHKLGIEHGHLHLGNVIPVGSRIGIIDFKLAVEKNVNWGNVSGVIEAFLKDYLALTQNWRRLFGHGSQEDLRQFDFLRRLFFRKLVAKYPMSDENKQLLFANLMHWSRPNLLS
ncbi:MAG TPA: hypothetical protein VFF09_01620 [archaeon]|nr:hypothetical protein [archaeon]